MMNYPMVATFVVVICYVTYQAVKKKWKEIPPSDIKILPRKEGKGVSTPSKWKMFLKTNWGKLLEFFKVMIPYLVVAWICWYAISSCTRLCNEPKVQVPERILTEGRFHWQQRPEGIIGGKIPDGGSCDALIKVNDNNTWQIVLSDNQGRVDHLFWDKSKSNGTWERKSPSPDRGEWWLEKVSHNEYRGWSTSSTYPGERLNTTLTLRR